MQQFSAVTGCQAMVLVHASASSEGSPMPKSTGLTIPCFCQDGNFWKLGITFKMSEKRVSCALIGDQKLKKGRLIHGLSRIKAVKGPEGESRVHMWNLEIPGVVLFSFWGGASNPHVIIYIF